MHVFRFLLLFVLLLHPGAIPVSAQDDCSAAPSPRLRAGMTAQSTPGQSSNVRDAASTSGTRLGQIPPDTQLSVLSDATCAEGYYWFQVDYQGLTGWTVEGADGEYWLLPVLFAGQVITTENINQLQVVDELTCPEDDNAFPMSWSPDGTHLFWSCRGSSISLTDWVTGETRALSGPENRSNIFFSGFSTDGTIAVGISTYRVLYWRTDTGELLRDNQLPAQLTPNALAISGDVLAVGSQNEVLLYDLLTLEPIKTLDTDIGYVSALAFSPDGKRLAFGARQGDAAYIWTIDTDELLPIPVSDPVQFFSFSPSGRYVLGSFCSEPVRGDCNQAVMLWIDASTGESVNTWQQDDWNEIWGFVFGPDMVFINGYNRLLDVMQISSDERIYRIEGMIANFLLSADGRLLLVGEGNRIVVYGIP